MPNTGPPRYRWPAHLPRHIACGGLALRVPVITRQPALKPAMSSEGRMSESSSRVSLRPARVDVPRLNRRVTLAFLLVGLLACCLVTALLIKNARAERKAGL